MCRKKEDWEHNRRKVPEVTPSRASQGIAEEPVSSGVQIVDSALSAYDGCDYSSLQPLPLIIQSSSHLSIATLAMIVSIQWNGNGAIT